MKVFQVINVRWYNATSWYALTLGKLLAEAGHESLIITLPGTETEQKAREMGLKTMCLNLNTNHPVRIVQMAFKLAKLVKAEKPDVVNCHRGESFFLWCLLKKLGFDFRLVRTRGDQRPPKSDWLNRYLHGRLTDAVVATNKKMSRYFKEKMRMPADRLWLVQGGVDTQKFRFDPVGREKVRAEFGFTDEDFVVGLVGRFDEVKGQKELIRSVATLYHDLGQENVRLFLIGFETATSQSQVSSWIAESDIGNITRISGKRDDVVSLMSAIDGGVVASLWSEAIARAALELMACQRPLVSTTVGVMPDLVCEKGLVPPGDIPALTLKLNKLIKYKDLRDELLESQKMTLSQLTLEEFYRRTMSLYEAG